MISEKKELMRELGEVQSMFTLAALIPMGVVEHAMQGDDDEVASIPILKKPFYDDLRETLKAIAIRMSEVADDDELFIRSVINAFGVVRARAESKSAN